MLKEKIEILEIANHDVLKISETKDNLKADYLKFKKSNDLKFDYQNKKRELNNQLDDATTYLVHQYEEFNDDKATNNRTWEKEAELKPFAKEIKNLKLQVKQTTNKVEKIKLKDKLGDLKGQISDTKILYSKSMKNRTYLIISLSIVGLIMLGSLLLAYLFVNPLPLAKGVAPFVIVIICLSLTIIYLGYLVIKERKKWVLDREKPTLLVFFHSLWIFFLDSLGIGCFSTLTTVFKKTGVFNDTKKIPATLNACSIVAGLFGGSLTLTSVPLDLATFIIFIVAFCLGSIIGSFLVNKINQKNLTLTMGIILAICTILMVLSTKEVGIFPSGTRTGLLNSADWWRMLVAVIVFAVFGMLLSFGIGIYAPTMILISLLGMQFVVATPIMLLCASFSGIINAYAGMKKNNYLPKTNWTITFGSMIGVFLYFVIIYVCVVGVGGVDLDTLSRVLKWISVPIIGYSAFLLLKSYFKLKRTVVEPKKKIIKEFNLNAYLVQTRINYQVENQKLNYQKIHW